METGYIYTGKKVDTLYAGRSTSRAESPAFKEWLVIASFSQIARNLVRYPHSACAPALVIVICFVLPDPRRVRSITVILRVPVTHEISTFRCLFSAISCHVLWMVYLASNRRRRITGTPLQKKDKGTRRSKLKQRKRSIRSTATARGHHLSSGFTHIKRRSNTEINIIEAAEEATTRKKNSVWIHRVPSRYVIVLL